MLTKPLRWAAATALGAYAALALLVGADRGEMAGRGLPFRVPAALRVNGHLSDLRAAVGRKDAAMAVRLGQEAVRLVPLDPRGLGLYATALSAAGQSDRAYDVFLTAGKMGWRDPITQFFWMQTALTLNDGAVAAMRFDGLLRTRPTFAAQALLSQSFEENPALGDALIARMQARPEWVHDYVGSTRLLDGQRLIDRVDLLQRLAGTGLKVGCAEIAQVVEPLARRGLMKEAYSLWRSHCNDQPAGVIMDGNFSAYNPAYEESLPFRWRVPASGDLNVEGLPQKGGGKWLTLRNVSPMPLVAASQIAMIGAGAYRISWLAKDAAGNPSPALAPQLWCGDATQIEPTGSASLPGGRWEAVFHVNKSCPAWALQFTLQPTPRQITFGSVVMVKDGAAQ